MGTKRTIKKSVKNDSILLVDALEDFLAEKEALNKAASTIRNYRQSVGYFMEFNAFDEESTTDEIKQSQFYKWMNTMKLDGVKPTSINHYLRDCRAFFYWCMDSSRKYIEPAFKIELTGGQEEAVKCFSEDDIEILLEKPKKNAGYAEWRTWAIVNWMMATGNRAATVCNVKIGDVDFKKHDIMLTHAKNKKVQIAHLSSGLEAPLKEFIRVWRADADKESYLFCNVGEEKLTTNALSHSFAKYCKDRGVEQTNIHGLRHSFARGWVRNNGSMFALQKILGHSTLDMTRKYVKLFAEDIKEDYEDFSPLDTMKKNARRTQSVKRSDS